MPILSEQGKPPPGPRKYLPGQMLLHLRRGVIPFLTNTARQYGDIAYYTTGGAEMLLLSHPELVKDVLVNNAHRVVKGRGLEKSRRLFGDGLLTSEGELHDRQRRLVQPAFNRQRIAPYGALMSQTARTHAQRYQADSVLDVNEMMTRLTMSVAGKTLFDADIEQEAGEIGEAFTTAIELFGTVMSPLAWLFDRLPFGHKKRFDLARARLDDTILRIIRARRESGADRGDLLSIMLRATDEQSGSGAMSEQQLRDECMTIFLAGHETVATALTWTWYLLAQNPACEARVHEEVDRLPADEPLGAQHLNRLPYIDMVLAESMRLYPPVWMLDRRVVDPFQVGGYHVPADAILVMCPYLLHRDERFYPEPESFLPERWTAEGRSARPRFSYIPFGGGPRQCIGEAFAWMELTLVMATIARHWRFELAPGSRVEVHPTVTLRPRNGLPMIARRRSPSSGSLPTAD